MKKQVITTLFLFFSFVYFLFLGKTGWIEQRDLDLRIHKLQLEVERLHVENRNLNTKKNLLKNDSSILEMEARKYYLLSENAHVLKFREQETGKQQKKLLAAGNLSFNIFRTESKKEEIPSILLYRILYVFFSFVAGSWAFLKLA